MEPWKGDHVHCQLPQVGIQLTWESETRSDPTHGRTDESVEVSVVGLFDLEGGVADVVEGLVVYDVGGVCVLQQLVHG